MAEIRRTESLDWRLFGGLLQPQRQSSAFLGQHDLHEFERGWRDV